MPLSVTSEQKATEASRFPKWNRMAERILQGGSITKADAQDILESDDDEILDVLSAAFRVRRATFGRQVQLYFLMNAKSGICAEDCHYCSQSKDSNAEIPKYNLLDREKLLAGAKAAAKRGAKTYCIVISARGPSEHELSTLEKIIPEIKQEFPLNICASLGLLTPEQAIRLEACGIDRINHNLNTSSRYYEEICSTHTYKDRLDTLQAVRKSGMEICSGGIVGMGETATDLVEMAFDLREIEADSVPVNFLNPIEGTLLAGKSSLTPTYCLKALAMFRFVNPRKELRIAGGRELHLRSLQPLGLYAANSIFVGDYLTTKGQLPEADYQMILDLGFEVVGSDVHQLRKASSVELSVASDCSGEEACGGSCGHPSS